MRICHFEDSLFSFIRPLESSYKSFSFFFFFFFFMVDVVWFSLVLAPHCDVRGRMCSSGDLSPWLVELQAFFSFDRWLRLSPFFATTSWLTWLSGDSVVSLRWTFTCICLSFALIVGFVFFCVCGSLTERSLGRLIPTYHQKLLKFLLHTKEVSSPGPSDVRAWSLLSLRRFFAPSFMDCEAACFTSSFMISVF